MNKILTTVFIFQGFIVIVFAIFSVSWQNSTAKKHAYLGIVRMRFFFN